jgi:hypothetical protein
LNSYNCTRRGLNIALGLSIDASNKILPSLSEWLVLAPILNQ